MQIFKPGDQEILIDGPLGALQIIVNVPEIRLLAPVAIVCHPHPLFQGTMDNKVVTRLAKTMQKLGMINVRFNYRGVGKSGGSYGHGIGEAEDLMAVMEWVQRELQSPRFCLTGFSFGCYVAYRVAALQAKTFAIESLTTIAPAVTHFDFNQLPAITCPWLIVQGEADDVVDPEAVFRFLEQTNIPHQLIKLPEVGHFFHGQLFTLQDKVTELILPYTKDWKID